jgi:hypothetical protein
MKPLSRLLKRNGNRQKCTFAILAQSIVAGVNNQERPQLRVRNSSQISAVWPFDSPDEYIYNPARGGVLFLDR